MRLQRFAFLVFLLVFLSFSVSAEMIEANFYVNVYDAVDGGPVGGASVTVTHSSVPYELTTDSAGHTNMLALTVPKNLNQEFRVEIEKAGYQSKTYSSLVVNPGGIPGAEHLIISAQLTPGDSSTGDYPIRGIVKSVVLESGECDEGFAPQGEFIPKDSSAPLKLCVEHVPSEDFTSGQYVVKAYLKSRSVGEDQCADGEIVGRSFLGGGSYYTFCKNMSNVRERATEQHVIDVLITDDPDDCPGTVYQVISDIFYDVNNDPYFMCTAIVNYDESDGVCELSDPQWKYVNISVASEITGWVEQGGASDYDFVHGDDVYLAVKAPGCRYENVVFEVYDGPSSDPSTGTLKYILSPSEWVPSGVGSKSYYWEFPMWTERKGLGSSNPDGPVYYNFIAKIGGSAIDSGFSANLKVNKPAEAECHYNPNSDADDLECGDRMVCTEDNICVTDTCTTDPDSCDKGHCDEDTHRCVECFENAYCEEGYGENYACDLNEDSPNYRTCYSTVGCRFSNLKWKDDDGFDIITEGPDKESVVGWIDTQAWQYGDYVGMVANAEGCEDVGDVVFIIKEKAGFMDQGVLSVAPNDSEGSRYFSFMFPFWQPLWVPTWGNTFLNGGDFEYYFYAASASDPDTPLGEESSVLVVTKPEPAQCHYDENSEDDDEECVNDRNFGLGYRCAKENKCVIECSEDDPCEDGFVCAGEGSPEGTTPGRCYECFSDGNCEDTEGTPRCSTEFKCVECANSDDCHILYPGGDAEKLICSSEGICTASCNSSRGNVDCAVFAKGLTEYDILAMSQEDRANARGNVVCHSEEGSEEGVCVQCNANYDPKEEVDICVNGGCCFTGTACLTNETRCVQCVENSICGVGKCVDNKCVGGMEDLGIGEGIIVALIGALVGFFIGGPVGAIGGGLLGLLLGGSGGDGGGILDGLLGGGGGGLGGILEMLMGFFG